MSSTRLARHVNALHMSWRSAGDRGYHHGNLKEALVRAALELIAEKGPGRLHLCRGGALGRRQPGRAVSAFPRPRRTAGGRGAARLRAVRGGAGAGLGRRPARCLRRVRAARQGLSGIRAHEPAYYSAMFEAGVPLDANPELRAGRRPRVRGAARRTETLVATMPAADRPPVMMMALHIWALSHGIASLFGRGDAARRRAADDARGTAGGGRARLSARAGLPDAAGRPEPIRSARRLATPANPDRS